MTCTTTSCPDTRYLHFKEVKDGQKLLCEDLQPPSVLVWHWALSLWYFYARNEREFRCLKTKSKDGYWIYLWKWVRLTNSLEMNTADWWTIQYGHCLTVVNVAGLLASPKIVPEELIHNRVVFTILFCSRDAVRHLSAARTGWLRISHCCCGCCKPSLLQRRCCFFAGQFWCKAHNVLNFD